MAGRSLSQGLLARLATHESHNWRYAMGDKSPKNKEKRKPKKTAK